MSQDGATRLSVKPVFRLDRNGIVDAFCAKFAFDNFDLANDPEMPVAVSRMLQPFKSRSAILNVVTASLKDNGDSHVWYWSERHENAKFTTELRAQVRVIVDKKFADVSETI